MNKTEEKRSNWYVFLIVGILIGAVLGYYVATKGWLGENTVGRAARPGCVGACGLLNPMEKTYNGVDCNRGCDCIGGGGTYNACWGFD